MFGELIRKAKSAGCKSTAFQKRTIGGVVFTLTYAESPVGPVTEKGPLQWIQVASEGVSLVTLLNRDYTGDGGDGDRAKDNVDGREIRGMSGRLAQKFAAELNQCDLDGQPLPEDADADAADAA